MIIIFWKYDMLNQVQKLSCIIHLDLNFHLNIFEKTQLENLDSINLILTKT